MKQLGIISNEKCTGCMACKNICPKDAIKMEKNIEGFDYPKIDTQYCVNCNLCKKVCPIINKLEENTNFIEVYACKNKNEEIRKRSSSGGIFTLIAEWILNQDGVVFGARFNENMEVVHDYVENKECLERFRGSKYLQSKINNNYKKVKEFLEQGRKVLFTGTPCQIEGLLTYLKKEYDNLYTQDIICHGVPSPKVWKKYMEYKKNKDGEIPKNVNFRDKEIAGWSNYHLKFEYTNQEELILHRDDPYMKLFLKNFCLRKSCYQCEFKKIKRKSDITVADFWGINKVKPQFNDEKGISAILVNSKKGKEIFENIKNNIDFFEAEIKDIIQYNSCVSKSAEYNLERNEFFKDLEENEFEYIIEKYL